MLKTSVLGPAVTQASTAFYCTLSSAMPDRFAENIAKFQTNHAQFKRVAARARLVDLAGRCTDLWRIIVVNTWGARDDAVEVMRVVELIIVSSVYYCYLQV